MRITALLLFLGFFSLHAEMSHSQNAKVTINKKNVELDKILNDIEKQTEYLFVYNDEIEISKKKTIQAKNKPVYDVLKDLFKEENISYAMEGSHIVLSKKPVLSTRGIAQDGTIKGTVVDNSGDLLIGVSVAVKGTGKGSMTDINGAFSVKANVGETLTVSYVGYTPQDIVIKNDSPLKIVMTESDIALTTVVVTALGIKREEKTLSYNVQEIKGEDLLGVKDVNLMNSLSGKVAGVTINASAAGLGGATRVVMRGTKSITKDNNALYVIDGIPIYNTNRGGLSGNSEYADQPRGEGIADLNPEDIESMSVLTGAAAAALYGSNAANGAIIITTKKGLAGKPKVTFSNQTTFSNPFVMPEFQNKYGNKPGAYMSWGDQQNKYSYNPKDFFDTGVTVQNSVSLSVGSEKNQTYISLSNANADGIIPNNEYRKQSVSARNTTQFLNDKLTLDFGFTYIKQKDKNMMAQGTYYNPLTTAYTFPRGEDFNAIKNYELYDKGNNWNSQNWGGVESKHLEDVIDIFDSKLGLQNPYWLVNKNLFRNKKDRYMMNVSLKYDIFDWMNVMGRARLDNSHNTYTKSLYATTANIHARKNGSYKEAKETDKQTYADVLLNINKYVNDFSLSANIGTSISDMRSEEFGAEGGLQIPNFFALSNISLSEPKTRLIQKGWHEQTQAVFANFEVGYKSMLYLTLSGRNDWASPLANTKKGSFFYPSVGVSGIITEMLDLPKAISFLKLRASYASVGSAIPRNLSIATYAQEEQSEGWQTIAHYPVTDLKPERTGAWEVGLASKFFGDKLTLDVTWYKSNTKNQTYNIPISASTGFKSMYIQSGDVQNTGVEIALGTSHKWGDFAWNAIFTASHNKNEIKQLVEEGVHFDPSGAPISLQHMDQGGIGSLVYRLQEGGTMGDLWYKNRLAKNEDGTLKLSEDGKPLTETHLEKAGSVLPKWNMGLRNDFNYKGITLGFLVSARFGGIVASPTQALLDGYGVSKHSANVRDNGGIPNGNSMIDTEKYFSIVGQTEGPMDDYIYSATNIRLQELSVGYHLPAKWFNNVMKVHVSAVGRNLWMIHNKAPFDPEATASTGTYFQGIDYFMQPSLRNIGFNVRVEF